MVRKIILIASASVMVLLFQNCGQEQMAFLDSVVNENLAHFNYNYKTAPDFYFNVNVVAQEPEDGYKQFLIVGGVAASDSSGSASISYEISMYDAAGVRICPLMEGNNQNGETLIEGSCVTLMANKAHTLESRVFFNGQEHVFTQNLNDL